MTDRRFHPANDRVVHVSLAGTANGRRVTEGRMSTVSVPLLGLYDRPGGSLDRQLLSGAAFLVLEEDSGCGMAFGRCAADGYVGYAERNGLGEHREVTHLVRSLGAHVYPEARVKAPPLAALPFRAGLAVTAEDEGFYGLASGGYVAVPQAEPAGRVARDHVKTAERLLGAPYLWGGDSNWGIDCSGLVQLALASAGIVVPRDSDLQAASAGDPLPEDAILRRGDLVFWEGHTGLMQNAVDLVHATAFHMAVVSEPLAEVDRRIRGMGGEVVSRRRPRA